VSVSATRVSCQAVVAAFRVLRADDGVQNLAPGSRARRQRIRNLLTPIAADEGMRVEDVATALAHMMST
jgi:hypothetical protein